jgi:hypothetical protein
MVRFDCFTFRRSLAELASAPLRNALLAFVEKGKALWIVNNCSPVGLSLILNPESYVPPKSRGARIGSTTERFTRICRGVAQLASAPGLGPGGRRFKSFHPDHFKRQNLAVFSFFYLLKFSNCMLFVIC